MRNEEVIKNELGGLEAQARFEKDMPVVMVGVSASLQRSLGYEKILRAWRAGATLEEIARTMKCSQHAARSLVRRAERAERKDQRYRTKQARRFAK